MKLLMSLFAFLVAPLGAALIAGSWVTLSVRLRMHLVARRVRRELEARLARGSDGVVLLRGKLVVEGDGCAAETGEGSSKIGARTHWGSLRRFWLSDALPSTNERAETLWLETGKERVRIQGALAVELGSALSASGERSFIDKRKRFDIRATLADGDTILVVGKRREEGDDTGTGGGYRKGASRGVLEPLPETGFMRARAAAPSRIARPLRAIALHPAVIGALLFGLIPCVGAAKNYDKTVEDLDFHCRNTGRCHVDSTLRWQGLGALRAMVHAEYFTLKAHDESECRTSSSCMQFGLCSFVDGACEALKDEDCQLSVYCENGDCSAVDGRCAVAKDADCQKRSLCRDSGYCSAVNHDCVAKTVEDCLRAEPCRERGECTPKEGRCMAASDEDCGRSTGCKRVLLHQCAAVDGRCTSSDRDCRAAPECAARGDCGSSGGTCVPMTDEDCRESNDCAAFQRCRLAHEDRAHQCVVDREPCSASDACRVHGRCGSTNPEKAHVVAGVCGATSDKDCSQSTRCKIGGACKRLGDECAASCDATQACRVLGACSPGKSHCVIAGEADCRKSDACKWEGRCAFVGGTCKTTDAECAKTETCRIDGRCSAASDGESCAALEATDCKGADTCKAAGACTAEAGSCHLASDADCAVTEACKSDGRCTFLAGSCVIGPSDCKALSVCKDLGQCTPKASAPGQPAYTCAVAGDEDCRDSVVCKRSGWCSDVEGHCFHR